MSHTPEQTELGKLAGQTPGDGTERWSDSALDSALSEDEGLALLKRSDLPAAALEQLCKNGALMKSRKVKLGLIAHPRAPRHVSVPLLRHLFTFDLMQLALMPAVAADVKMAAEENLISRLEAVSEGERLALARRASGRVAGALLLDGEPRVIHAALGNPRLAEAEIVKALMRRDATPAFVVAVCHHPQWSLRREIRIALLRNENTPLARALEFARSLPRGLVCEVLQGSRLPADVRQGLLSQIAEPAGGKAAQV